MTNASTTPAATVEFEHVTKVYGAEATKAGTPGAVNDLSLTIPAGRICVLVGPSGCGKTTSLKMVNRLIEPTSGRILLDGVDAATRNVTELRRGIGYVIQQTGLFPHQTIEENVATVPRLLGWSKQRRHERAEELLALVGLDPAAYASRYPAQLSGGERQRVGVARALAADPPIMLMDEPFGAVDPIVRERLQNEFLRLQEQLAKTILFVTHDIDEAIKMGDLVAVYRGLKRMSLTLVNDLELVAAVTARVGDDAADSRRRTLADPFAYLLVLDAEGRPLGWVDERSIPDAGAIDESVVETTSPLLDRRTTLKDALSMLLDRDVQAGVVVDRRGVYRGLVTVDQIAAFMRDTARPTDVLDIPASATELAELAGIGDDRLGGDGGDGEHAHDGESAEAAAAAARDL
jgi:osmoprotectant transport system ATP-binding protein